MDIGKVMSNAAEAYQVAKSAGPKPAEKTKKSDVAEVLKKAATARPSITETEEYGKTIGDAKLSDKAKEYYKKLKSKFSDLDFVLVSEDQKGAAQANAASYGNSNKMVVLINEEKLEKMAADESYRKKYEGIIAMGQKQMSGLSQKMSEFSTVAGYGMDTGSDGTSSYFAVVKKANKLQQERIEEKRAEKKAAGKAQEKKAAKAEQKERLEEKRAERKQERDALEEIWNPDEYEIIRADSVEELFKKVSDYTYQTLSDNVTTEAERMVGQSIDFKA